MIQQTSTEAPLLSEILFSFYRLSPLFSILLVFSALLVIYLLVHRLYKPESVKFKIVSLEFNQLTLSTIFFFASLTGYIVRSAAKNRFAIIAFIFVFIFLSIVSLLYKSTDRRH